MEFPAIFRELESSADAPTEFEAYDDFAGDEALEGWFPEGVSAAGHFAVFGQDGTGGLFAFWLYEGAVNPPIVLLGSEGETEVLANSPEEFIDYLSGLEREDASGEEQAENISSRAAAAHPDFGEFIRELNRTGSSTGETSPSTIDPDTRAAMAKLEQVDSFHDLDFLTGGDYEDPALIEPLFRAYERLAAADQDAEEDDQEYGLREFLEHRFYEDEYMDAALASFRRRPSAFTTYVIRFERQAPELLREALERDDLGEGLRETLKEILEYAGADDEDIDDDEDEDDIDEDDIDEDELADIHAEWKLNEAGHLNLMYGDREDLDHRDLEFLEGELPGLQTIECRNITPEALRMLGELPGFRGAFLEPELYGPRSYREFARDLIPAGPFVLGLVLQYARNKDLALLNHFPNLEKLVIRVSDFRDSGFAAIESLPRLKYLELPERTHGFDGTGLRHLHGSPLENLDIHGTTGYHQGKVLLERETFAAVAGFKELRELRMSSNYIGEGALEPLGDLTALQILAAFHVNLKDSDMEFLSGLESLRELSLFETQLEDGFGARLSGCSGLTNLDLHNTRVGNETAAAITEYATGLQELNIINTRVDGQGLRALAGAGNLRELGIGGKGLKDDDLKIVEGMASLKRLGIRKGGGIGKEARERLRAARPDMEIEDISPDGYM